MSLFLDAGPAHDMHRRMRSGSGGLLHTGDGAPEEADGAVLPDAAGVPPEPLTE